MESEEAVQVTMIGIFWIVAVLNEREPHPKDPAITPTPGKISLPTPTQGEILLLTQTTLAEPEPKPQMARKLRVKVKVTNGAPPKGPLVTPLKAVSVMGVTVMSLVMNPLPMRTSPWSCEILTCLKLPTMGPLMPFLCAAEHNPGQSDCSLLLDYRSNAVSRKHETP